VTASGTWRTLTAEELAAEPGTRFGGAIAVIFFAAVLLLVPVPIVIAHNGLEMLGVMRNVFVALADLLSSDMKSAATAYGVLQILAFTAWAAVFVVATLLRWRSGATIAAVLFAICVLLSPVNQILRMAILIGGSDGLITALVQVPHLIVAFVAAVAYWSYMRDGRRPNLYFGRRVRV
jgi:hypothetical protein